MIDKKLRISMGQKCSLHPSSYIGYQETGGGTITLGANVQIKHDCVIRTCSGNIVIGTNVIINYGCIMHGMGGIQIGYNTMISPRVQIYAQNHGIKKGTPMREQRQTGKGIIIENDVWVGAGAIILDGVTIGEGAIVGAGAVVTKPIPPNEIWAGNPAKKIGERK